MAKYKLDVQEEAHVAEDAVANGEAAAPVPAQKSDDLVGKATTIAAVAAGVALFEVALIPGMVIGVAAALAPNYLPKLGSRMKPVLHTTVRGAYKIGQKARSAVSEAQEHLQDIAAEVKAEQVSAVKETPAAPVAQTH